MTTRKTGFSWKKLAMTLTLSLLVGIGAYAVAWQFNDGKIGQKVIGAVLIGMALPSLILGGVMRLFRPDLQRYFAITALSCLLAGMLILSLA